MALTLDHIMDMIRLNIICEYDASPDLKGYSIGLAKYGTIDKWEMAVGMDRGMELVGKTLKVDITLTL